MLFLMISTAHDDLCCRVVMHGIVHLVLYGGKEIPGNLTIQAVVNTRGVDICDLLIKSTLACANFLYLGYKVLKIIIIKYLTIYQTLLIQYVALLRECVQHLGCPCPKFGSSGRVDAISHSDDRL